MKAPRSSPTLVNVSKDLVAASATTLVLGILAEHQSYGYAILKRIHEVSDGQLQWTDGMLYPLLHRLERLGYVHAQWGSSETGRRRRYYGITDDGLAALAHQQQQWQVVDQALRSLWREMSTLLGPEGTPP